MILVVGLSSVWQRTLFFKGFRPGEVNRVTRVLETASGKGVNVARVVTLLGEKARILTTAGGARGELFKLALKADSVPATIIPISGETRLCQTLIGARGDLHPLITEIVEESPALSPREVEAVLSAYAKALRHSSMIVLSGTVPAGCGDGFYAELTRQANRRNIPVLVDTQRIQLMQAVRERPSLVKINQSELAEATGTSSVPSGIRKLMGQGASRVIISHGAKASAAYDGRNSWQVKPPTINVVNPIGSGDSMMAGIATRLLRGGNLVSALRLGVACGAANALTETSGVINPSDVNRLLRRNGHKC